MTAPFVVLGDAAAVDAAGVQLRRSGHDCRSGFDVPAPFSTAPAARVVCTGAVDGPDTARAALLAAAQGASVIVWIDEGTVDDGLRRRFLSDLARLGPVTSGEVGDGPEPVLTAEQRELLECVADGASIPEAAAQLFVSVRTAERRMAQVRAALGVRTTAAAAVAYRAGRR